MYQAEIRIETDDYLASIAELQARTEREPVFDFSYAEENYQTYMMNDILRTIINGLTFLISLISAANIFNTITANIALRRRDFGMLKSIGMTNRDIDRMMGFECLSYGSKALLAGIPLGLIGCGITYYFVYRYYKTGPGFPWQTIGLGSLLVFVIVFASAFYAVAKMRRDNPIEAIRRENL